MNHIEKTTPKPRKLPRQARATVTVEAIFSATIQVLLADGAVRLTTTRVAERAGVSVGTLYQYFPDKQALLYAVLRRHLEGVAQVLEDTVTRLDGKPLAIIAEGLATAWLDAKTANIEISRALYAVAAQFDIADLVREMYLRMQTALKVLLLGASDVVFPDLASTCFTLRAVLVGTVRTALELTLEPKSVEILRRELPLICAAYLRSASQQKPCAEQSHSKVDATSTSRRRRESSSANVITMPPMRKL